MSRLHLTAQRPSSGRWMLQSTALLKRKRPHCLSTVTPITPDQGRDLCITRLERDLQVAREIPDRLTGENEKDLRIHPSRAAGREKAEKDLTLAN